MPRWLPYLPHPNLASQDPLSTDDSRLAHVGPVVEYIRNGLYKYAVGSFDSSVEAGLQKSQIQTKDFRMRLCQV